MIRRRLEKHLRSMRVRLRHIRWQKPDAASSTEEERREYIKETFPCIADCDMCGLCAVFNGKDPELAYADYISGKREYMEVSEDYR